MHIINIQVMFQGSHPYFRVSFIGIENMAYVPSEKCCIFLWVVKLFLVCLEFKIIFIL